MAELPWFHGGLRFACTRCGACCTGAPGTVRVDEDEARALARHLGLDELGFRARYTRRLEDGATSLVETAEGACVFWSRSAGCTVYPARPTQCRTWPFWRRNLASPAHWTLAARACPGIGRGERHEAATIARAAEHDGTSGTVPAAEEL
jgi:hypothetical protein